MEPINNELHTRILRDLKNRATWDARQRQFYEMRTFGMRRKVKPWPTAADMHVALIDRIIERLKPNYVNSALGNDVVAGFVPMRQQLAPLTVTAERYFDYKIRERTAFQFEIVRLIDDMLLFGRSVLKSIWDEGKKEIIFQAIDPTRFIVPDQTVALDDADYLCHVMVLSVDQYKRVAAYNQDEDFIKKIAGRGTKFEGINTEKEQAVYQREGITYDSRPDRIILWEIYTRNEDDEWNVCTYSPLATMEPVREDFVLPYKHGQCPFTEFSYELTNGGFYSSRGVAEILAANEMTLAKLKNSMLDFLELANRPLFQADNPVSLNMANLKMQPGQILPQGIKPVQMTTPPMDFMRVMYDERAEAEQRVGTIDFGVGNNPAEPGSSRKTATEIQALVNTGSAGADLRNRLFRMSLGRLFRQCWSIYLQYDKKDLNFRYAEDTGTVPPEALHEQYSIMPKGGYDFQTRQFQLQKAVARMQLLGQSPFINQAELVKSVLELDDPSLVRRLVQDPMMNQQEQREEQAKELAAMMTTAFPIAIKPTDDHRAHLEIIFDFQQAAEKGFRQVDQATAQAIGQHLDQHLQALEQIDPNTARAITAEIKKMNNAKMRQQQQLQGQQGQLPPPEMAGQMPGNMQQPMA